MQRSSRIIVAIMVFMILAECIGIAIAANRSRTQAAQPFLDTWDHHVDTWDHHLESGRLARADGQTPRVK